MSELRPAHPLGSVETHLAYFAARHARALTALVGLLVLAVSIGGTLEHSNTLSTTHWVLRKVSVVAAVAVCAGWWRLSTVVRRYAPRGFLFATYRGKPAFASTNNLSQAMPLALIGTGFSLAIVFSTPLQPLWWRVLDLLLLTLVLVTWLRIVLLPSRLYLTPSGLVCRWLLYSRTIKWDAVFAGQVPTCHEESETIWILTARSRSRPQRRTKKTSGRPAAPDGYRWIRASDAALVEPAALAVTIRHYRDTPDARSLIGTAAELERLQALR